MAAIAELAIPWSLVCSAEILSFVSEAIFSMNFTSFSLHPSLVVGLHDKAAFFPPLILMSSIWKMRTLSGPIFGGLPRAPY